MLSPMRKVLKKFHPEGIPWPGTALYNAVSRTNIFQQHYELISRDILTYRSEGRVLDIGVRSMGVDISPSMVAKARKNI